ncbi:hypothetical protein HanPI659440_Chr16g0658321 [Helianthus annuus]|nr:hypothetical protein HanPI659440_Chr16g0658321 [Helianthus annuus]
MDLNFINEEILLDLLFGVEVLSSLAKLPNVIKMLALVYEIC